MKRPDKDQDEESAKYEELADKVDELSRERASLEKRIRELELRVTGSHSKDEMTYNFIVEKQTTQMQWSRDRDSPGSPRSDGKDTTPYVYRNVMPQRNDSRTSSFISGASTTHQTPPKGAVLRIEQIVNSEQQPRAVFGENGELFIIYSSSGNATKPADGHEDDGAQARADDVPKTQRSSPQDDDLSKAASRDGNEDDDIQARGYRRDLDDHAAIGRSASQDDNLNKPSSRGGPDGNEGDNVQARAYLRDLDDTVSGRSVSQDDNLNNPSSSDGRGNIQVDGVQTRGLQRDSDGDIISRTTQVEGNLNKPSNKDYADVSPYGPNQYDNSRAGQQQLLRPGREPMLPQVIVVTGLKHSDLKHDVQECSEDETGCNCYQIMKESEAWKDNVTKLLELLVMNAYGSRCPRSLIKALMDPSTREQAIAELLDRTFPASDNTVSQDNIAKDRRHKETSGTSLNKSKARTTTKDTPGMTRTFAQFPPYPPASFESKDSLPRHAHNKHGESSNRTPHTQQGGTGQHSNKIDIVCPPGSRPVIHIPPSGAPAVTCDKPPRTSNCCTPKNPCVNHK